jgi:tetratricopeptide (TPR) repeat protein
LNLSDLAGWVRDGLLQILPDGLDFIPAGLPDWALLLAASIVILVVIGLILNKILDVIRKSRKGFRDSGRVLGGGPIEDPSPATKEGQAAIQRRLDQFRAESTEQNAKIEAILAAVSPPAEATTLGVEEEAAKKDAVIDLVSDTAPAAIEAAQVFAAGDVRAGFDSLEQEARSAETEAAVKWRRLGALATGVDTARARTAYEQAFELRPEDFWTCVELARLRRQAGDLSASGEAAIAAEKVARTDRERFIADTGLGDVLVKAGDLSGATARFEASLKVSERLAETNPGSAEAQRDLIVSYAKLGEVVPHQGWWSRGLAVCERLAAEGRLAPTDAWMLDELRERAAGEA